MFVLGAEGTAVIHCGITLVVTVYPLLEELFTAPSLDGYDEYQWDTDDHDGIWLEFNIHLQTLHIS